MLAYGLAFDSLLGSSIGWDFLPTTAELTGRAPVVAKPAGVAGTWLTWRLRMALGGLSRAGDPGVTAIADQWQAMVAQHRESLTPDALDTMLAFVEDVRARQAPVGEGPGVDVGPKTTASSPTSSPTSSISHQSPHQLLINLLANLLTKLLINLLAGRVGGAGVAGAGPWTTSAGYFGEHAAALVGPESAATLRQLLAANPDDAKLRLPSVRCSSSPARVYNGKAFDYLKPRQPERAQADNDRHGSLHHQPGCVPRHRSAAVRRRCAGRQCLLQRAGLRKMMTSINWLLDGNAASAVELATDARRHLSGRARIDFLKVLGGLGSEVSPAIGPGTGGPVNAGPAADTEARHRRLLTAANLHQVCCLLIRPRPGGKDPMLPGLRP